MFSKIFAFFALMAVAYAAPSPKPAPAPAPQFLTYGSGLDYTYPSAAYVPSVVSPYAASAPLAYSASAPLAYSGYPAVNTFYY